MICEREGETQSRGEWGGYDTAIVHTDAWMNTKWFNTPDTYTTAWKIIDFSLFKNRTRTQTSE